MKSSKQNSLETDLLHLEHVDGYNSSNPPLYQTTTFKQNPTGDNFYDYTRSGNPTRSVLEAHLSKIMRAKKTFAVTSGMSCLDVLMKLLNVGDEVIAGEDLYGGTHRLLTFLNAKGSIKLTHVDTSNVDVIKSSVTEKTRMLILESPTNPLIKVVDLPETVRYVKQNFPKCLIVFDNTMMSPVYCNPLDIGVDIQYESATKYLNGHHDIMAGVIAVKDQELADKLYFVINSTGCGLAPFECWLLMRGLKTLAIRVERQQENCLKVAKFLQGSFGSKIKVNYPGLSSHPQHELHKSFNRGYGSVLSFETGSIEISEKILNFIKLFNITVSFGCVNSLISMPCRMSHASIDEKTRKERNLSEDLIRVCVGIENADDLIFDLLQAMEKAGLKRDSVARL